MCNNRKVHISIGKAAGANGETPAFSSEKNLSQSRLCRLVGAILFVFLLDKLVTMELTSNFNDFANKQQLLSHPVIGTRYLCKLEHIFPSPQLSSTQDCLLVIDKIGNINQTQGWISVKCLEEQAGRLRLQLQSVITQRQRWLFGDNSHKCSCFIC